MYNHFSILCGGCGQFVDYGGLWLLHSLTIHRALGQPLGSAVGPGLRRPISKLVAYKIKTPKKYLLKNDLKK